MILGPEPFLKGKKHEETLQLRNYTSKVIVNCTSNNPNDAFSETQSTE